MKRCNQSLGYDVVALAFALSQNFSQSLCLHKYESTDIEKYRDLFYLHIQGVEGVTSSEELKKILSKKLSSKETF